MFSDCDVLSVSQEKEKRFASRETLCLRSKEYSMDGTRSAKTNIYLFGAHVTVDVIWPIYPAQKFTD